MSEWVRAATLSLCRIPGVLPSAHDSSFVLLSCGQRLSAAELAFKALFFFVVGCRWLPLLFGAMAVVGMWTCMECPVDVEV